jgi:histidine triad (HIT) family protein
MSGKYGVTEAVCGGAAGARWELDMLACVPAACGVCVAGKRPRNLAAQYGSGKARSVAVPGLHLAPVASGRAAAARRPPPQRTPPAEARVDPNDHPTCIFCRIIGGDEMVSIIHEDEEVIAFLDIQPLHRGHVLVVPKHHYKNLFYVPEALATRAFTVAKRILPGLRRATGCRAVNLFSPNGADGGQDVFHFHLHLIPVPREAPFPLQLPDPGAPVPSRSELDVMATRIMQCVHQAAAEPDEEGADAAAAVA